MIDGMTTWPSEADRSYGFEIGFLESIPDYSKILAAHCDPIISHIVEADLGIGISYIEQKEEALVSVSLRHETHPEATVFMSHGLADKCWRDAKKLSGFAFVFVSGPVWVEKLVKQGRSRETIVEVGYPYLDPVFACNPPRDRELVFWSPTHTAIGSVSSHGKLDLIDLSTRFRLLANPHPYYSGVLTRDLFTKVLPGVVIADSGSVLYEAWALGVPVVFPDWIIAEGIMNSFPGSFESEIYRNHIGWHAKSYGELIAIVSYLIEHPNELGDGVSEFMEGILPTRIRGCSARVAAENLIEILLRVKRP